MARLTISLAAEVAKAAKKRAAVQKRSTSSYVQILIERDLGALGLLNSEGKPKPDIQAVISEARALGIDPVAALRARIAEKITQ